MRRRLLVTLLLFAPALSAQIGSTGLSESDLGLPPHPPLITFLGMATPGKWATDPSLFPSGPLEQVDYEDIAVNPGTLPFPSQTIKFNEQNRPVELVQTQNGTTTTTRTTYENSRVVSSESTSLSEGLSLSKTWEYWKFDLSGKLIDYRGGHGDTIESHVTSFKRDPQERTTSYECHQQPGDKLFSRKEISTPATAILGLRSRLESCSSVHRPRNRQLISSRPHRSPVLLDPGIPHKPSS